MDLLALNDALERFEQIDRVTADSSNSATTVA